MLKNILFAGIRLVIFLFPIFFLGTIKGQCNIEKNWVIQDLSSSFEKCWSDVDIISFADSQAVFLENKVDEIDLLYCLKYLVVNDTLLLMNKNDTLKLRLSYNENCSLIKVFYVSKDTRDVQFILYENVTYPYVLKDSLFCNLENSSNSSSPINCILSAEFSKPKGGLDNIIGFINPWLDRDAPLGVFWQVLFLLLYFFYLAAFIILRFMGRILQSNYCWLFLCLLTGIYSFFVYGPFIAFTIHFSIAFVYFLKYLRIINSIGKLAIYGAYAGCIVLYEMILRFGLEGALNNNFLYLTPVPGLAFLCGLPLMGRVIKDAYILGFNKLSFNIIITGVLYCGPYIYICESRNEIFRFLINLFS